MQLFCYADVTKTVGATGADYATLKLAFDAINAGTINTGVITLQIIDNTTDNATAVLYASGIASASYSSVRIYPTVTGKTITGAVNAPLIDLNGADNVTIDGRLNATGSTKDLTIVNTSTSASGGTSTIRLINDATSNTVKYCTLKGSSMDASSGIVLVSSSSSGTTGNDTNTIDNNDITCASDANRPINAIFSQGTSTKENSGNTFSNNNIYNFLNRGAASNGLNIFSNNTGETITGNSFYETTTFAPTASVAYSIILVNNTSGNGFVISGNYIGGNAPLCSGTFTKTSGVSPFYNNTFFALNINVGSTTVSSIQNNIVKNINWTNSAAAAWSGISVTQGAANVGTTTGNTIGASTGTGSVTVTGGATNTNVYGISIAGNGAISIQNNTIGSITTANSDAAYATNIYGIYRGNTGTTTISANTIGSLSEANSIQASSASTTNVQKLYGIYNFTGGTSNVNNNIIANLNNATTNSNPDSIGLINGITSSYGIIAAANNTVRNLSIANANTAANHTASVCGIALTSTNSLNTITGNTIYNLQNTNTAFAGNVIGLYFGATGTNHVVTKNFIHSLSVNAATSSASIYGIKINTGATTYSNNIISVGGNTTSTLYGIYETGTSANNNNLYFNTVYLSGVPTSGSLNSFALYSAASTNTRNFRNNILYNARSNSGASGTHYGAYLNYGVSTALTLDYNDYYVTGTGGILGFYNGSDDNALPIVPAFDASSMTTNPALESAGGTVAANYKPTSDKLGGILISTFTTDYVAVTRAASPTIGAYEVNQSLNVDVYKVGVFQASYFKIKDAFDKINSGTHTGDLELRVKANTTETASAALYQSGYTAAGGVSNYTAVKIYPTGSGLSISGSFDGTIIDINGADNVTIDGRVNLAGAANMTIINSNVSTYASAIKYSNSAENNILRYCTVKSSTNNSGVGSIQFGSSAAGNGNDNNIVEYCNLTNAGGNRPVNVIFSSGGSGRENSGIIIRNNNIYDFFNPSSSSYGVNISYNSTDWVVTNNSFYQTATFVPAGAYTYSVMQINTGNNHIISNNFIGGSEPLCAGTAWTSAASKPYYFCGFYVNGGSACTIQNNTLQNMDFTSTEDNPWDGIYFNTGNAIFTGNTIGATTGTGSIKLRAPLPVATAVLTGGVITNINLINGGSGYTTAPIITFSGTKTTTATATATITDGVVTGFTITNGGSGYSGTPAVVFDGQSNNYTTSHPILVASTGIINISNNNVGSITTYGTDYYSHGLECLYVRSGATTLNVSNNLFGSLSTVNSLQVSSSAFSALQKQDIYGIYSAGTGTATISGNTVSNLYNGYTGLLISRARGIVTSGGSNIITNNTVKNIVSATALSAGSSASSVIGITQTAATAGTTQTVSGNTISNLSNTHVTAATAVVGIYYAGPAAGTHKVNNNFIHSLSASSSNVVSIINGLFINSGLVTCANNIINLGVSSLGYLINGIWDGTTAGNNVGFYFNTVYIGGSVSAGVTSNTACLWNANNTSTRNYRNNIFYNARTGGTTGKHYAIVLAGTANTTIDYNDYIFGAALGKIGSLEKSDLAAWKIATLQDANSLSTLPNFAIAGGTNALDYYSSAVIPGVSGTGVLVDYDGLTRGITPKMGALEYNNYTWIGATSSDFGTASNWDSGEVPPNGANIIFHASPTNHCLLDQNRSLKNITNGQASKYLVLNGKQLTLTGEFIFTNSAKVDGTTAFSSVVYAGTTAQSIASGTFLNNTIDTLTINNPMGLNLNCDFTIEKGISLIVGNFAIGANTLTFNGEVTNMTGSATGGTSTTMIIGGSGSTINMPPFTLANLTINRANGVTMYGDLNIVNELSLTNGTLTVGANTLTLNNTPLRTTGNIDASNAAANVIFANPTAVTLPASLFSGNVNNLTVSGAGGLTSATDFTVNGMLNLAASNPSAIKGLLDMWDGATMRTLTMGAYATTVGAGDVTGIVTRNSFVINTPYSFGNEFTTINMADGGTLPTSMSVKIVLSSDHTWKTDAIHRYYDIIQTGGTSLTKITTNLHYLDSELNGATPGNLDLFDYHKTSTIPHVDDHGRSNDDITNKWVGLANMSLTYIARAAFDNKYWTLGTSTASSFTWLGAIGSDWDNTANWVGGVVPGSGDHVTIPDASATPYDPVLPPNATVGYLQVQVGGILNDGGGSILTIDGGYEEGGSVGSWDNMGTFNAGTSTVIFTSPTATMSDPTNFYHVTIAENAKLTLGTGNVMRIAGELVFAGLGASIGVLNAANTNNVIEFNGADQTIINPNGLTSGYYNLILSGSGTKTLATSAMSVKGDFTVLGTATVNAGNALTIDGSVYVAAGSTFVTGAYNHSIKGDLINNGTFTASAGSEITLNGNTNQLINGDNSIAFDKLTINNNQGVTFITNENVNNTLTLTAGNLNVGSTTLGINGTIAQTAGLLEVSSLSNLSFGGSDALTLNNGLFSNTPSINNLTINRSGGVTLGNQSMTVNGLLDLSDGTFAVAANTLTLTGGSPTRTTGGLDVSNSAGSLIFSNTNAITLPSSFFATNVNNLTISGTGGITSPSDFTVNGILNLQAVNPSATKGILDLWDGASQKTISMGATATTVGLGDVTGIIRRTSFVANTVYTFGNQFSNITFDNGGTYPTEIQFKVNIGAAPSWKSNAILRSYDLIRTGGSGCIASISAHYLDSELNSLNENELVLWNFTAPSTNVEYGSSTRSTTDNWAAISYVNFLFFPTAFGQKGQTLGQTELATSRWNGSVSTSWTDFHNWDSNSVPNSTTNVTIPDASTTPNSPILPASTEIKTLLIENAGVLNSDGSPQLTINGGNGAWSNSGTFNPATGTVIFTNVAATISGTTTFNNLSINSGSTLWMSVGSTIKVAGTVTNSGTWRTVINGETTVEYSGDVQTVVTPNASTNRYYNLSLSGSGVKTLPLSPLSIIGNLNLSGTASTTITDSVYVGGNVSLASGTSITVSPTKILNVAGKIYNNAGESGLTIKASETVANGSVIFHNAQNETVPATIEMYSKASKPTTSYKWQFFGIPVRSMNVLPYFSGAYVRKMNEAGTNGGGFEPTRHWVQLAGSSVVNSFAGYEVTQLNPTTFTFSGVLENSNYDSGQLSYTQGAEFPGQHLIANSYTAAIDISKIEFGSADQGVIENTVYLYNTGSKEDWLAATPSTPSLVESNVAGQYIAIPKNVANRGLGIQGQIPSMQAFLVKVNSVNANAWVKIPYSATGTMLRNSSKQRAPSIKASTRIEMKATKYSDFVWLLTEPACSSDFDNGWDGYKNIGSTVAPQLFAVEAAGKFQVDSKDDIDKTTLAFIAPSSEVYSLIFTHQNLQSNYESLYLFDSAENKYIDIAENGTQYDFYASKSSTAVERFKIVTKPGLMTEVASLQSNDIQLYSNGSTIYSINSTNECATLNLYDLSGRMILHRQLEPKTTTSTLVGFQTGLYIAKVVDKSNSVITTKSLKIDGYEK